MNKNNSRAVAAVGNDHQAVRAGGQKAPSLWRLHTIADALGVRVRDLFV